MFSPSGRLLTHQVLQQVPATTTAVCHVDLGVIWDNYRTLQKLAGTSREVGAVVKANSYGLGAKEVVKTLLKTGCRHFYVAYPGEALELRGSVLPKEERGDGSKLFVLTGLLPHSEDVFVENKLVPFLGSLDEIERWNATGKRLGRRLDSVVHVDTGMARTGLEIDELKHLAAESLEHLNVLFVASHFASSDEDGHPQTGEQREAFGSISSLMLPIPQSVPRSLANSCGIAYTSEAHCQHVRSGLGIYGLARIAGIRSALRCSVRLSARVISVRTLESGRPVGYNARFRIKGPSRIATVGVGHFDGLSQAATNRFSFRDPVSGVVVPQVGTVSMDLTGVDVTKISSRTVVPGDWLEYVYDVESAESLASASGCSVYEVITRIGSRHHRVYTSEGHQTNQIK